MLVFGALGMRGDEAGIRGQFVFSSKVAEPSDFVISPEGKQFEEKYWVRVDRFFDGFCSDVLAGRIIGSTCEDGREDSCYCGRTW